MKRRVLILSLFLSGCAAFARAPYDVLLDVSPMSVKEADGAVIADAIAGTPENPERPKSIVVFRVNRVLRGEFTKRRGGPSRFDQISDSFKSKDFLGALNYQDPEERIPQEWIIVAVEDAGGRFGLDPGPVSEKKSFRLYLSKAQGREGSYYLVQSKPV